MYHYAAQLWGWPSRGAGSLFRRPTVRVGLRPIYFDDYSSEVPARARARAASGAVMRRFADAHILNGVCVGILAAGLGHGHGGGFCVRRVVFPLANLAGAGAGAARFCLPVKPLRPWPGFAGAASINLAAGPKTPSTTT